MKRIRKIIEKSTEYLFALSGSVSGIVILLIVLFLFREGLGLFNASSIEKGYSLYLNSKNTVDNLSVDEIKKIFDSEITNWQEVGGNDDGIMIFRFEDIFTLYADEGLEDDESLLPEKLGAVIAENPGIIAFIPQEYAPVQTSGVKKLSDGKIAPGGFFGGREWFPTATPAPLFGILPLIAGTLLVSIVAIIIALPLGLGVAIYISELAGDRMSKLMKPAIELLAGIPSVVYGFFGLAALAPAIQQFLHLDVGETAFTGSIVLAVMALPTIITIAEDSMRNTPQNMREASMALGATRWQTIYRVIIPYASSGISAAAVLGIGRAVGETMAVLMVTGNAAIIPHSLFEPVRTIPATIAAELGEAPAGGAHYRALFLLGCILFIITMIISVSAELISKKQQNKGL